MLPFARSAFFFSRVPCQWVVAPAGGNFLPVLQEIDSSLFFFFVFNQFWGNINVFFFRGGVEHDIGEVNRNEHAERIEKVTSLAQLRKVRPCVIFPPPGLLRLESFPS